MQAVDATGPYDDDNIFAKILRQEIPSDKVYEDDHAYAFRTSILRRRRMCL